MPTQPLVRAPALVDEVVAVVDEQLQVAEDLLVRPRPAQLRLPQRRPGDRERVDRVRLPARSAGAPFRRHQLRRHPHNVFRGLEQLPLEPAGELPTVLERPQPLLAEPARPDNQLLACDRRRLLVSIRPASSTATAVTDCLCTSTPITIISITLQAVGSDRRADRPQSRRKPRSYQVTLDGLGRRRRHNAGQSALGRHRECGSAAAGRVCDSYRTPPRGEDDIEFANYARAPVTLRAPGGFA